MELQQYIKELLFRHDCIILPEFGGFVANYRPAEVNYQTHSFSPPSKDIVFNAELRDNDGLLIGHISKSSGMSYVDARKWVEKQVKELSRKLEKGKKVYLEDIGTFHLGKDKNILFEPARSVNYLTEAYGLADFQFSPLEAYSGEKNKKNTASRAGLQRSWKWVAVAVPVVAALFLIPLKTDWLDSFQPDLSSINPFHKKNLHLKQSPAEKADAEGGNVQALFPSEATSNTGLSEREISVTPSATENKPVVVETAVPVNKYYIVAGSFQHRENADVLKQQLAAEGKNAVIMDGPSGFYRVAFGGFPDKSVAEQELTAVRRQKGHENYWIVRR